MPKTETSHRPTLGFIGRLLRGQVISGDFFVNNAVALGFCVLVLLGYISSKYEMQTRMEALRKYTNELETVKAERVRARSLVRVHRRAHFVLADSAQGFMPEAMGGNFHPLIDLEHLVLRYIPNSPLISTAA